MADDRRKEDRDMLKSTKNRQSVSEKLEEMGIEEGTYMMFSERDARGVVAKNEFGDKCPMSTVLDDGAYKASEKGKDVLASYNAGVSAFYFAEGVYVISTSEKARLQAQQIEGEQGFIGVAIGKNDTFVDTKGNPLDELTTEWEGAKKTTHRNETKEKQEKAGLGFSQVLYDRGGYGNM